MESTQIRKKRSCKGYTLVELMAVIAIMAALAAVSAGIYSGYVERAREAELYETAEQIKNALAICEAQYGEAGGSDASVFWSEAFLAPPNHRDSVLYPYVGAMTEDCTGYSLKIKRNVPTPKS